MWLISNVRLPSVRGQVLISICLFVFAIVAAYQLGNRVVANDTQALAFVGAGFLGCGIALAILRDWRFGLYGLLGWMTFEDLFRKYMGNGLLLFFGKDILAGFVYLSLFIAIRKRKEKLFQPPFMIFLSLFFWLGVLEIFNPYSPSIWFGLLGIKTYFYYAPLMYAGYAFVRSDEDLRKFLSWNLFLAGIVAAVGVAQSVVGNTFLNPPTLASELQGAGYLEKVTPISNQAFNLPDSVFVSTGRYSQYLILVAILALGSAGYIVLCGKKGRALIFAVIGILGVAALLSGSRGCLLYVLTSAVLLPIGFLWGAPWRFGQAHKMLKAIRRSAFLICLGLFIFFAIFPEAIGSRIAFYSETLLPSSSSYQLGYRSWDYPVQNFMGAFDLPNWVVGNGIGTASLGGQYVAKLVGQPFENMWVEEGYGNLIVEMGILGPILWLVWTIALIYFSWKTIRALRQTRYFPLALAIAWYAFIILFPMTFFGLSPYEDYTCNTAIWLFVGVLFRLPTLEAATPTGAIIGSQSGGERKSLLLSLP
jgi:hypothetical protein